MNDRAPWYVAASCLLALAACDDNTRPGSVPGRGGPRLDGAVFDVGFADLGPITGFDGGQAPMRDANTTNGNDGGTTPGDCPGAGTNVCRLKTGTWSVGDAVRLERAVVTSPPMVLSRSMGTVTLEGVFVQDTVTTSSLDWKWSGIIATYNPADLVAGPPSVGDMIAIDGTYNTFGLTGFVPQRQVRMTGYTVVGAGAANDVAISDLRSVAAGGAAAEAYEGVPIRISGVAISATTVTVNGFEVFGAFEVDSLLPISGAIYSYPNPVLAERFTSIAGILRLGTAQFEAGTTFLTPTSPADLVPEIPVTGTTTIRAVQDPNDPGHPTMGCRNDGGGTTGTCAPVTLTRVLVTAADARISTNLRAFWVQDPSNSTGRYAGVRVIYSPAQVTYVPEVGHYVDIVGEIIEFFGGTQIQFPTITRNGNDTSNVAPIVVPSASSIARTMDGANPYEGALVQIANVVVTEACVEDDRGRDHGDFVVSGDVLISATFPFTYNGDARDPMVQCFDTNSDPTGLCGCNAGGMGVTARPFDQRRAADQFTTISGVVDYSFQALRLQPRGDGDLIRL